ncbi:glycosyl transferase [Vulcanimicrobium alpinum]|uniref:Glycosyl transferase n=1 Tax=Vulcanimicrobium alpinum TaxID=3016050 RepID=A0AAN1XVQ2_UNVUL|nr:glycosyltransferase [Vulcanimicrobium alpinum]BDE06287.1 glycosyl transferase [Vulcanimicrobium alpinum]
MTTTERTPLVSIGLPVYNGERFLREAIDSILAQTFTDFELIISDNASTDATNAICLEYAARDPRVRYVRNERNMGASYNYNRVTELSRGKYIRHAAYDDVLAPTNIERCVEVMEADDGISLCYPQMSRIDEHGRIIDTFTDSLDLPETDPVARWRRFHELCDADSMCDPVFGLFRGSVLKSTPVLGRFASADVILLAEVALRGRVHEVREVLFFERWFPGTSVNANRTPDDRAAWFDPNARGRWENHCPHYRWLTEYIATIGRAPLTAQQKLACLAVLAPWIWKNKHGLVVGPAALALKLAGMERLAIRTSARWL